MNSQTMPRPPAERTFVVAVTLLGLVALIQIAAVVVALAPEIRLENAFRTPAAEVADVESVRSPANPQPAVPEQQLIERANGMLDEAQALRESGEIEKSLEALAEAEHLVPGNPIVELAIGRTYLELGKNVEAAEYLQKVAANPRALQTPEYAPVVQQAQMILAQIETQPPSTLNSRTASVPAANASPETEGRMRDEVGIPIGSVMGIVEARLRDGDPGAKKLQVSTKASEKEEIDPQQLKTMVYFFEQNDHGDVMQTQSPVTSDWLSPPVDWANEPELLEVTYPLPLDDRGDLPPLQYYGFIVGVYYKGELQDFRAEPGNLADQFPLKFTLPSDGQ